MSGYKIETWTIDEATQNIRKRLDEAKKARSREEDVWIENEITIYGGTRDRNSDMGFDMVDESVFMPETASYINLNYAFSYVRFLHAQLSSNPPTSLPVPTSQDLRDREAAKAADQAIHYGRREYDVQEWQDDVTLETMLYGSGWGRCSWCPAKGRIAKVENGTAFTEGDIDVSNPSVWDVWIDPEAKKWKDVRYVYIRHSISVEEAVSRWPEKADEIRALQKGNQQKDKYTNSVLDTDNRDHNSENVDVYEYIEKGLPWNGAVGRYVWCLESGTLLTPLQKNPYPHFSLPIRPLTDIDVPGHVYGRSIVQYLSRAQEVLAALDSTILDNIQSHGVVRLVLPDGAKVQDDGLSNNGWEYVTVAGGAGNNAPFFMSPPALMPDIYRFREQLLAGMETLAGINENMMGKQSREMSGLSMQTAINAGNMVRRRLFNKYTKFVNWFWETYLDTIVMYWSTSRMIKVSGEEGAMSTRKLKGADIASGFDLQTDYGTSFSLDPASRREEILQAAPMLEKAGVSPKKIVEMIQLNEAKGLYDINDLARKRQLEVFEEMIDKAEDGAAVYIPPEDLEEHKGMLEAAYEFVMLRRFKDLEDDVKKLIVRHIKEREQLAAQTAAPAQEAAPGAGMPQPGGAPAGPMPPMM